MEWGDYEQLVAAIYEQLGSAAGVSVICSGANCKVVGKSGVKHQIDVLTEHSDGVHKYRTAIECKYWSVKVSKDTVTKLSDVIEDSGIEKGVIVSRSGFTDDAVTFAKYKNISLVELREPTSSDWKGRIKDIGITIHIKLPTVADVQLVEPTGEPALPIPLTTDARLAIVEAENYKKSLSDILLEEFEQNGPTCSDVTQREVRFPENATLSIAGIGFTAHVTAIRFRFVVHGAQEKMVIHGPDYVAMIMTSLFDNKRFVVDQAGNVHGSCA